MVVFACSKKPVKDYLKPLKNIKLNIPEPSGITYYNNHLYIVSDQNGTVYQTNLEGKIQKTIRTRLSDLEGVTFDAISNGFWLISEEKRKLFLIDSIGNDIYKFKIKGKQKHNNSGVEGVCFSKKDSLLYIVNEKSPKQLLKLNLTGEIISTIDLKFANDISGISTDDKLNNLWIISDESNSIYNINNNGELIKKYKIAVPKAEGIVVYDNRIYIVSDNSNKLYVYTKPN